MIRPAGRSLPPMRGSLGEAFRGRKDTGRGSAGNGGKPPKVTQRSRQEQRRTRALAGGPGRNDSPGREYFGPFRRNPPIVSPAAATGRGGGALWGRSQKDRMMTSSNDRDRAPAPTGG